MPAGGARRGSGRKPGSGNPLLAATRERHLARVSAKRTLAETLGTEDDPARVLVDIATDPETETRLRVEAAVALMPYAYPRLSFSVTDSTVRHTADGGAALTRLTGALDRLGGGAGVTIEAEPAPAEAVP